MGDPGPRKLQTTPAEGNLRRRKHGRLGLRQQSQHMMNGIFKALQRRALIWTAHQVRRNIPAIRKINRGYGIVALVVFVQVPLGRSGMQVDQPLTRERGSSRRQKQF